MKMGDDGLVDLLSFDDLVRTVDDLGVMQRLSNPTVRDIAEYSFIYFVSEYLGSHLTNRFSPAHYELAEVLESPGNKRLLWLFPREHAKTTLITFAFTLWCICYRKKRNIVICSDSKEQATEFLRNIKTELENNVKINRDFGDLIGRANRVGRGKGKWGERHIITSSGTQVKVWSPHSQVRGLQYNQVNTVMLPDGQLASVQTILRPDLLIFDDILNDKHVRNLRVRDELYSWLFSAAFNAMDSVTGDIIIVGTILHNDDVLSRLWNDTDRTVGWIKRRTPACRIGNDGIPVDILWPDRWPADKLLKRRHEIGSLAFSREFLLNAEDEGSRYFNYEWFRYYVDGTVPPDICLWLMQNRNIGGLPDDLLLCTAIDPAFKMREMNDYTSVTTLGFSPSQRNYYVLCSWRDRVSPQEQIMEMIRQAQRYSRQLVKDGRGWAHLGFVIETYAAQYAIKSWLKQALQEYGMTDFKIYERAEYGVDKSYRIGGMSPMVEQRRLYFPLGYKVVPEPQFYHPLAWLEQEMSEFPRSAHDDGVDSLQRAYSVLLKEERRFALQGMYGPSVLSSFDKMIDAYKLHQYLS